MAAKGEIPEERSYKKYAPLEISKPGAVILDPMSWDDFSVELAAGTYTVRLFCVQYPQESEPRISCVRVSSSEGGKAGKVLGQVAVDAAVISILDARALDEESGIDEATVESSWQTQELSGFTQWGTDDADVMVFTSTGFGDGTYDVVEIISDGKRIGFEIRFIEQGSPYPF